MNIQIHLQIGSLAQLNRASDYGSEGYRFESYASHLRILISSSVFGSNEIRIFSISTGRIIIIHIFAVNTKNILFKIKGKIKIMGLFTGNFYSKNLRMTTQINVIFPDVSNDVTPLYEGTPKVLYLLHGLSGNSDEWTRFSKIEYYAKK